MTLKTSLYQSQQLRQELKMNPRLYQAMELLYMPLLDLQQHLKQELTENPFLELSEPEEGEEVPLEEPEAELETDDGIDWEEILLDGFETGGRRPQYEEREYYQPPVVSTRDLADHLIDQLRLLPLSSRDRILGEEIIGNIGDDGYLTCSLEEVVAGLNEWLAEERERLLRSAGEEGMSAGSPGVRGVVRRARAEPTEAASPEGTMASGEVEVAAAAASESVEASALGTEMDVAPAAPGEAAVDTTAGSAQAGSRAEGSRTPAVAEIGTPEVTGGDEGALERLRPEARAPRGGGVGAGMAVSASDLWTAEFGGEYRVSEAERMLEVIQSFDPPGVGARDIRECLLLQLKQAGKEGSRVHAVVRDHFDDLVNHRWAEIARAMGISVREVQDAADEIARFDPKPGLRYSPSRDEYVIPDLIVDKVDGEYMVFLNDTSLPRLRISRAYQEIARHKDQFKGENKEFIANKLNAAQWMIQAIEQRRQTMLRVMHFIVDRQRDFFEKGVQYLKPLTLREIADAIGMHESTISRVTNEKYVQTPRGVFSLKFFFSSGLSTTTGEDISARGVKDKISKLVADEDPHRPLTDQAIVEILKSEGVQIARRTVAKYRDQLGILPARMRKRV